MSQDNANEPEVLEEAKGNELLDLLLTELLPQLKEVVVEQISLAVALHSSPTMTKENFAAINGLGLSTLEKWISNGVVLLAPTPTSTVRRKAKNDAQGEGNVEVMQRHGNPLINVAAWREKNRQHAINCRYIKR